MLPCQLPCSKPCTRESWIRCYTPCQHACPPNFHVQISAYLRQHANSLLQAQYSSSYCRHVITCICLRRCCVRLSCWQAYRFSEIVITDLLSSTATGVACMPIPGTLASAWGIDGPATPLLTFECALRGRTMKCILIGQRNSALQSCCTMTYLQLTRTEIWAGLATFQIVFLAVILLVLTHVHSVPLQGHA